uniref:serine/threonine-protein kinase Nek4 isoform X3 n=1 Tax=Gasterosteus aculeatus aculeatus TaxID=481459 RepID=UPI001A98086B|nr:serine/threonine-protein kinase Nek4 isoform X3 [Gasterosteus aculeatus aculeatus]
MMNNYIFIRVVGKGSYGEVNLVKHKTDRKQYVIKKLNLTTSSKRERRSAEQEAQLLSQLRHPNIVTYRESWEGDDCQLYIVMGFCEGGDLYHRLKQQKGELLPERQVVEWFVQIAMALQYLHERNILHRDLKTQNIFLTKTNIIKVGDLGIARVLENQNDMASTLIGTPYYMSPELFSNKPYNHKSDVWALGCCVYEMSTLKHAFNAKDMNSLVYRIVEGKLPQMPSRYDLQLGELIKCMLCRRPEDRPDVKLILRQPYIKQQIAMFLEATKEKTAKSRKKAVGGSGDCRATSAPSVVSSLPKPERGPQLEPLSRGKCKEDKTHEHRVWDGFKDDTPVQTPQPPKSSSADALKASIASLTTISNINVQLQEEKDPMKGQDSLESTEKLLQPLLPTPPVREELPSPTTKGPNTPYQPPPFSSAPCMSQQHRGRDIRQPQGDQDKSKVTAPRPLPPPPVESVAMDGRKRSRKGTGGKKASAAVTSTSVSSSKELLPPPQDRPLSARERRRLRQSVEIASQPGVSVIRRASYDVSSTKDEHCNASVARSVSASISGASSKEDKLPDQRSDEDECSSSTSSTERSEGDCKERKTESRDIQDLVHMMTQTLNMDIGDCVGEVDKDRFGSTAVPEFKLNRKYRDTLVLHGKARGEAENLSLREAPICSTSGPAKIRRAIEHLRTDVVKGLGVKLLDRVLEIMEVEDDTKRELCLRDQMGDEKYQAYAVMVRQLKFFEDISVNV